MNGLKNLLKIILDFNNFFYHWRIHLHPIAKDNWMEFSSLLLNKYAVKASSKFISFIFPFSFLIYFSTFIPYFFKYCFTIQENPLCINNSLFQSIFSRISSDNFSIFDCSKLEQIDKCMFEFHFLQMYTFVCLSFSFLFLIFLILLFFPHFIPKFCFSFICFSKFFSKIY